MILLKNSLPLTEYWGESGTTQLRYRIDVHSHRQMSIPMDLIDNSALRYYMWTRVARYHTVCYSNLWLLPITQLDRVELKNKLHITSL